MAQLSSCGTLTARPRSRSASVFEEEANPEWGKPLPPQGLDGFAGAHEYVFLGRNRPRVYGVGEPVH